MGDLISAGAEYLDLISRTISLGSAYPSCQIFESHSCESTMDEARNLLRQGMDLPFVYSTAHQSKGRGRNGANWQQHPSCGLAATFVMGRLPTYQSGLGLSLVVGLAAARMLEKFGVDLQLKWPNDLLLLSGQKVGGILIELIEEAGPHTDRVVPLIGIGLNLDAAPENLPGAGVLPVKMAATELIEELACALYIDLLHFKSEGFRPFQRDFNQRAAFCGQQISFSISGEQQTGRFLGVNSEGAMEISLSGAVNDPDVRIIHSADQIRLADN